MVIGSRLLIEIYCLILGRFIQLLAIRSHIPEIICQVTDGSHWIDVKFNQQNLPLFLNKGFFAEGQILKVMTSSIDEENYIVIVSVKCSDLLNVCIISIVSRTLLPYLGEILLQPLSPYFLYSVRMLTWSEEMI